MIWHLLAGLLLGLAMVCLIVPVCLMLIGPDEDGGD